MTSVEKTNQPLSTLKYDNDVDYDDEDEFFDANDEE